MEAPTTHAFRSVYVHPTTPKHEEFQWLESHLGTISETGWNCGFTIDSTVWFTTSEMTQFLAFTASRYPQRLITYYLYFSQFATPSFAAGNSRFGQWLNNYLIYVIVPGVAGLFRSILIGNTVSIFSFFTYSQRCCTQGRSYTIWINVSSRGRWVNNMLKYTH